MPQPFAWRAWHAHPVSAALDASCGAAARVLDTLRDSDIPGQHEALRATLESDLAAAPGLSPEAMMRQAQAMLEQGRLYATALPADPGGFDPHRTAGDNGLADLGNLLDLFVPEDKPAVAETPRPSWVEVAVVDARGEPIRDRPYRLILPTGEIREGTLDATGIVRFDDVDPGMCRLEFPTEHAQQWAPNDEDDLQESA